MPYFVECMRRKKTAAFLSELLFIFYDRVSVDAFVCTLDSVVLNSAFMCFMLISARVL